MTIAFPSFVPSRCTRFRFAYSQCERCLEACPHAAISLHDAGATLDHAKCQNCGLCTAACQTGAWGASNLNLIELVRLAIKQPAWSIACAPSGANADAIAPCLGSVDAVTLAYLAKRGVAVELHGEWFCADCHHGKTGAERLALNLEAVEMLHQGAQTARNGAPQQPSWKMPQLAKPPQSPPQRPGRKGARAFAPERRRLFRRLVGRGIDSVLSPGPPPESQPPPQKAIRPGPYATTERRELQAIVTECKDGAPFPVTLHESLPLMELTLHSGCTVCEACLRVCPTGALQIEENPRSWALQFELDRCLACQVCLEVCQPRVLDACATFDARSEQPARVLLALHKQRCSRCDRYFVSHDAQSVCAVCRDDEDAFTAIFG